MYGSIFIQIYAVDSTFIGSIGTKAIKNFGKSSRGRAPVLSKTFRAPIYTAHRVVILVIAQLSRFLCVYRLCVVLKSLLWWQVLFTLYLTRRSTFYLMNIILPCTLLSILMLLAQLPQGNSASATHVLLGWEKSNMISILMFLVQLSQRNSASVNNTLRPHVTSSAVAGKQRVS